MATTISVINAVIPARGSITPAVDLSAASAIVGLIMPQPVNWTPAIATVQGSVDGVAFHDLFDGVAWVELQFNARPDTLVMLNPNRMRSFKFVKIRSGTHANPIPQNIAACTFGIVVEN